MAIICFHEAQSKRIYPPFLGDFFEHNSISITMKKDVSLKKFLAQAHF